MGRKSASNSKITDRETVYCVGCDKDKKPSEFYRSYGATESGLLPYCKKCCIKYSLNSSGEFNVEKFKDMLKKVDRPFLYDILSNNFDSLYREYFSNRCAHYERFNDLFDIDTLFSHRSRVYLFSNEPLKLMFTDKAFFSDVDLSNKSIFSIIASGDFFFNLCLFGCKNMTLVDINEYAYYYFEIKKAMIKKYNYEEFITMYKDLDNIYYKFNEYSSFIKDDIRNKIINKFSLYADDVSSFVKNISWSCSYEFNNLDNIGRRIDFFRTHNLYLSSEDNYNKLKSVLLKDDIDLNMYVSSLFDLDLDNMEKFDYIYLSNIGDYCDTSLFYEFLLNIKNKILNETGKIILVYRTDNYKYLLDKNLKITRYNASFDTSLDNVIIYCSFY